MCSYCDTAEETAPFFRISIWGCFVRSDTFFFANSLIILPDLSPQSAIIGFQQLEDSQILKNLILLIFKMVLFKDRESKSYSFERFLNKVKMIMKIEHALCTNMVFNTLKWNPIRDLLD